jgi:hypothetical protein
MLRGEVRPQANDDIAAAVEIEDERVLFGHGILLWRVA